MKGAPPKIARPRAEVVHVELLNSELGDEGPEKPADGSLCDWIPGRFPPSDASFFNVLNTRN